MHNFINDNLTWITKLSSEDRKAFRSELIFVLITALRTNRWSDLYETLRSWKATAEALCNKQFMDVVNSEPEQRSYTEVER
jgi:hypothetical protein